MANFTRTVIIENPNGINIQVAEKANQQDVLVVITGNAKRQDMFRLFHNIIRRSRTKPVTGVE